VVTQTGNDRRDAKVCVIIAAKDASSTIGMAVSSALSEPEVVEVIVVDDGSTDYTVQAAQAQDDGTSRLKVYRLPKNKGPSYARNYALNHSTAPLISILDADDFFLPGRFSHLLAETDWDMVADNIVFIEQKLLASFSPAALGGFKAEPRLIDLTTFVEQNISKRNNKRGELGFVKPMIRRDFLDHYQLRYDEDLRLGEDYDLYVRAMAAGARFRIIGTCGYAAVVRDKSLSSEHSTDDLYALAQADGRSLRNSNLTGPARRAVQKHQRHILHKYHHRRILDIKKSHGLRSCIAYAWESPLSILPTISGILQDKLDVALERIGRSRTPDETQRLRYLFDISSER
jgi:succinoglycan biosynthesis protein ExoU